MLTESRENNQQIDNAQNPQTEQVAIETQSIDSAASRSKGQRVLEVANHLFQQEPDWVTFFREVLGIEGLIRKAFPTAEEMAEFEQSEESEAIQQMLSKLRERSAPASNGEQDKEPTRVITVRLPKSLHESLRAQAHERRTSMNKLCISKLLQFVDEEMASQE